MGSGQQGLGEHFQPFPNLYDVCNQISKEEYLTATHYPGSEKTTVIVYLSEA